MTILGVDVSHYQATSAAWWKTARAGGVQFGIAKSSQGTSFTDPTLVPNVSWMRAAGVLPGAYHFLVGGISGATQADYYAGVLAKVGGAGGLLCVVDVESTGANIGIVRDFAARFKARYPGHQLIVYTGRWFWRDRPEIANADGSGIGPLWHSAYPASRGTGTPAQQWAHVGSLSGFVTGYGGWARATIWQYSDNATVAGVRCDADAFQGTLDQLRALTGAGTPVVEDVVTPDEIAAIARAVWATPISYSGTKVGALTELAQLRYKIAAEGTSPDELNAALGQMVSTLGPQLAEALKAELGGSVDAALVEAAAANAFRRVLTEGTGGTP
jgi:GH25 family lysozyme M1 (1,4-beta-N-acetylmuramidase)